MDDRKDDLRLTRKLDRVYAHFPGNGEPAPVRLVWARPISGKGQEVSVLSEDKKEIAMIRSLDDLDADSRRIAEAELEQRYLVPKITRVIRTMATFGNRYWAVETDRGHQAFLMKDPNKNAIWVTEDRLILRDTIGNRYEIESLRALDDRSRAEIERVI